MKKSDVKKLINKIKINYDKEFPASELGREIAMMVGFNKYKVSAVIKSLVEFQVIKPTESINYYEWDILEGLIDEEKYEEEQINYEPEFEIPVLIPEEDPNYWKTDISRKYYLVEAG